MPEPTVPVEAEFTLLKRHLTALKRRGSVRYRSDLACLGRLILPPASTAEDVWVHDLSDTGIGLNLSHRLEAGSAVVVRLKGTSPKVCLELPARVVHCTQEVDGTWRAGCAFDRRLAYDELDALL